MNLSGLGTSDAKPFLFLISVIVWAASLWGSFSQWSKVDCQIARPDVAERSSFEKPKVSATGMKPLMKASKPFCSKLLTFPRRVVRILEHSPESSEDTETVVA